MIGRARLAFTVLAFGYAFLYLPIALVIIYRSTTRGWSRVGRLLDALVEGLVRERGDARRRLAVAAHRRRERHARHPARPCRRLLRSRACRASPVARCSPSLVIAPMVMPEVVMGISMLLLFVGSDQLLGGPQRGFLTITDRATSPSRSPSSRSSCRRASPTSTARSRRRRWISARRRSSPSSPSPCR
jgi:putrescine transport system permease protein